MKYLIIYSQGSKWREGITLHDQPFIPEHAVYAQQVYDQGKSLMGGPFGDHSGGLILLEVESLEHAIEFAENDPAVINDIFNYQVKPWHDILNHYENRNPNFDQSYLDHKHKIQRELNII